MATFRLNHWFNPFFSTLSASSAPISLSDPCSSVDFKRFFRLQATCERGFAAMEETHQKKIEDLLRQHHRELEKLRDEKDRLLAEETAATISGT